MMTPERRLLFNQRMVYHDAVSMTKKISLLLEGMSHNVYFTTFISGFIREFEHAA